MIIQNMIRTVTMTVIVKVPTVIATAEDMDTELNLMDPQFWGDCEKKSVNKILL